METMLKGHPFRHLLFGMLRFESGGEKEILDVLEKMESNNDTDEYWGFWKHVANQMPTFVSHVFLETLIESEIQLLAKMNYLSRAENIVLEVMTRHVIENGEDNILNTIWESGSEQDRVESFIWKTVCNNDTCLLILSPKTRRILLKYLKAHSKQCKIFLKMVQGLYDTHNSHNSSYSHLIMRSLWPVWTYPTKQLPISNPNYYIQYFTFVDN